MKPKHLRIAGVIFALALAWQGWQYFRLRWSLGVGLWGGAVLAYALMEWLARKEQEKLQVVDKPPRPPEKNRTNMVRFQ